MNGRALNDKPAELRKLNSRRGFTIIELLIVVVVIAILAAITIVSYNGITRQAKESSLKSTLTTGVKKAEMYKIENSSYPDSKTTLGVTEANLTYAGDGDSYCMYATSGDTSFYVSNTSPTPTSGKCPLEPAVSMQTFTLAHCAAATVFDGSNASAIYSLTDSRGGTTHTYEVAKLADGKCWMLTNLKLGSTSKATILTPTDSDIASNFELPRLYTNGTNNLESPKAYGPITGDTGSGATNYGYLYNWTATTAGLTTAFTTGNAPHSICPAGWRLPTGGSAGEFAVLNAKMNNSGSTGPSNSGGTGYYQNWSYSGPFKGVLSGSWNTMFLNRESTGYLWSSSASSSIGTFISTILSDYVYPGDPNSRGNGYAVRCLLR